MYSVIETYPDPTQHPLMLTTTELLLLSDTIQFVLSQAVRIGMGQVAVGRLQTLQTRIDGIVVDQPEVKLERKPVSRAGEGQYDSQRSGRDIGRDLGSGLEQGLEQRTGTNNQ